MKIYTTSTNGIFEISTKKLRIDLSNTSKENPQEVSDEIGKALLNGGTGVIFEVKNGDTEQIKNKRTNDTTKEIKVAPASDMKGLEGKKRNELYKLAREKGYKEKYIDSSKEGLIEFLEKL